MPKRLSRVLVLAVVAALCAVAAGARPGESHAARTGVLTPFEDLAQKGVASSYSTRWQQLLTEAGDWDAAASSFLGGVGSTAETSAVTGELLEASAGAGALPALGTIGLLGATAFLGYKIVQHFTDGHTETRDIYIDPSLMGSHALQCMWGSDFQSYMVGPCIDGNTSADRSHGSFDWATAKWETVQKTVSAPNNCPSSYAMGAYCMRLDLDVNEHAANGAFTAIPTAVSPDWYVGDWPSCSAAWASGCWPLPLSDGVHDADRANEGPIDGFTRTQNRIAAMGIDGTQPQRVQISGLSGSYPKNYGVFVSTAAAYGATDHTGDETGDPTPTTINQTMPATLDIPSSISGLYNYCGEALVNSILDSAGYAYPADCVVSQPSGRETPAGSTFLLPQPGTDETYTAYLARLRAAGWVGTATEVDLPDADTDPTVGPSSVSEVGDTTTGDYWLNEDWPTVSVAKGRTDAFTFYVNPSDAAPAPTGGDSIPTSPPPTPQNGGCPCSVRSPDFTPLTTIDYGDKFPFGVLGWAAGWLGAFNQTPEMPHWTLPAHTYELGGHSVPMPAFALDMRTDDFSWYDSYLAVWRDMVSFLLWAGAVWFIGTRLLGFHGAGDPSQVLDGVGPEP